MSKGIAGILVAVAALFTGQASAQEQVNVHFNVMLWAPFGTLPPGASEPPEPLFWYVDGGKPIEIKAEWNVPTRPLRYSGPRELQFYRSNGRREGEPILQPILSAPIPPGAKHVLYFIFTNESGGFSAFPVDVGLQDMPKGSVKLINFSGEDIAAKIGDMTKEMENRSQWIVPVSAARNFQLRMQIAARQNGQWKLLYRTSYAVNDDSRKVLFLHRRDFTSGPFRVRPIAGFGEVSETGEEFDIGAMEEANRE